MNTVVLKIIITVFIAAMAVFLGCRQRLWLGCLIS